MTRVHLMPALLMLIALLGGSAGAQQGGLRFQTWRDPAEGAFTLDVPVGWRISGGTVRPYAGAGGVSEVVMTSPDGKVTVRVGDVRLPSTFLVPNPTMASLGCSEGCHPSASARVLRYLSGQEFASYYVAQLLGSQCPQLGWTGRQSYPDYVRRQAQTMAQAGMSPFAAHTAGDVTFLCKAGPSTRVGYFFAETYAVNYQGTGSAWAMARLQGHVAVAGQAAVADVALQRAMTTMKTDPRWFGGELAQGQRISAMQLRYNAATGQLMQQMHEFRLKSTDRWAKVRGDLLLGR